LSCHIKVPSTAPMRQAVAPVHFHEQPPLAPTKRCTSGQAGYIAGTAGRIRVGTQAVLRMRTLFAFFVCMSWDGVGARRLYSPQPRSNALDYVHELLGCYSISRHDAQRYRVRKNIGQRRLMTWRCPTVPCCHCPVPSRSVAHRGSRRGISRRYKHTMVLRKLPQMP
jgi:hypothetical protein